MTSDGNDADDDCTPSATGNDTETAAANRGENVSGATKAGASNPSSTGKDSARGGKGSRGGSRGGRAGGSAGPKRKVSAVTDPDTDKPSPKTTKSKVGANGKVKKSIKAAGPRPVGPLPSTFCFFDPPPEELVEDVDEGADKKATSKVAVKEKVKEENNEDAGNTGHVDGDDDDDDDDHDPDDLQNESPGRKKVKLEDVTVAASEILNNVTADIERNEKMVGVATSASC